MLKIFKYNTLGQIIIIVLTAIALWAKAFVVPVSMPASNTFAPLYDALYGWMSGMPRVCSGLALLLVLAEGCWLNVLMYNHKVIASNSLLPAFLYLIAMSWDYSQLTLTPMLFVNLTVLLACRELLSQGATTLETGRNFNASFCIGLATLFYLPAIGYVIPMLFVFVIYKMYRWRHLMISLLGLVAPLIILVTYAFMADKLAYWLILMGSDIVDIAFRWDFGEPLRTTLSVCFTLLLLWALSSQAGGRDKVSSLRINTGILTLPLLAGLAMSLYGEVFPLNTQAYAISFTFLTAALLMVERKRRWIGEVALWVLLLCGAVNVYLC